MLFAIYCAIYSDQLLSILETSDKKSFEMANTAQNYYKKAMKIHITFMHLSMLSRGRGGQANHRNVIVRSVSRVGILIYERHLTTFTCLQVGILTNHFVPGVGNLN